MKHVANIRKMIDDGQIGAARTALEDLLELGPNNLEALKLKAALFASEGRFKDEESVWLRVLEIDNEDPDAIAFLQKKHIEDREHYYFTDDIPGGGRRYLAYPRALVQISALGLLGCILFLLITRLSYANPVLSMPEVILPIFLVLVMSPWAAIIYTYCRSIRTLSVSKSGIEIATRFRKLRFQWPDLEKVCLGHGANPDEPELRLVLIPRAAGQKTILIDLNEDSSSIRARTHLVRELGDLYAHLSFESFDQLGIDPRKTLRF